MNFKSIKFRLTIWYFFAFFLSAAVMLAGFYYLTQQTIFSQTDKEITQHGQAVVDVLSREPQLSGQSISTNRLTTQFSQMPGILVAVSDKNGSILTSTSLSASGDVVIKDVFDKSASIIKPTFINRSVGTTSMRLGVFPITTGGEVVDLVIVGHPIDVIRNSLITLVRQLLIFVSVMGALAIIGSLAIARRALRPVTSLSAVLTHITSNNLTEQVINPHTGDEMEELSLSFNTLLSNLAEAFTRERQFIGDVAHELRTPLSIIKNSLEVTLSKKRTVAAYQQVLSSLVDDVDKLSSTVNEVLDLAWTQSDQPKKFSTTVNLTGLVTELSELAANLGRDKKIYLITEISPGVSLPGDRKKLFRALFNLVDNAVKYTPVSGKIAITLTRTGRQAVLEISNTGPGITPEELPFVFDRFYRGKDNQAAGSGLGLAIAKSIIIAHSGQVSISSQPGKITTLKVIFPSS